MKKKKAKSKPKVKAEPKVKIVKHVFKRVNKLAEEHHTLEHETDIVGPLPPALLPLLEPDSLPLEITPDAAESEKQHGWLWNMLHPDGE